ncbi:MAG: DUF3097 family protein [Actinobacteria bacterium]|nr:DUF3097 family protein [Actinomycetota bacterium]
MLSGPLDVDAPRRPRVVHPTVEARRGLVVRERGAATTSTVVDCYADRVVLRDGGGRERLVRLLPGAFEVDGRAVTLAPPAAGPGGPGGTGPPALTASGSVVVPGAPARVARASRILVEGVHDAELVEKVWGDDLRVEGVVVERLDGADRLPEVVRSFGPRPGRRLGVLLDHLVDGSKEARLAATVDHPDVLVLGHPFVDVWQAVRPSVIGVDRWPEVPPGRPWKHGVLAELDARGVLRALGVDGAADDGARFWRALLGAVRSWTDLESSLIGAVEALVDFVTAPA